MRQLTVCGGRLIIRCPCGHEANGHQPSTVAEAMTAHEGFTHGKGLSPDIWLALRMVSRVAAA